MLGENRLLCLSPPPIPFLLANSRHLLANCVRDPLVHIGAIAEVVKNLEVDEEGCKDESWSRMRRGRSGCGKRRGPRWSGLFEIGVVIGGSNSRRGQVKGVWDSLSE